MAKGAAFERDFCKTLSLWWSDNQDETLFWRTAGSGGRATVRGKKGKGTTGHCGDICATSADGEPLLRLFALELKRGYSRCTIADLLDKPDTAAQQTFETWLEQANESRRLSGAHSWMLIVRRDRREPIVFMLKAALDRFLALGCWEGCKNGVPSSLMLLKTDVKFSNGKTWMSIAGLPLSQWLGYVKPDHIKRVLKEIQR